MRLAYADRIGDTVTALYMYDAANSPDLALCKRRGAIAMAHYLTRSYAGSSPQPDATRKLGMGALLNMEGYAAELKGATRAKGRSFAEEALGAVEKGVPRDGTVKIFYSVDTDLTDLSVCDDAFRGINDVHAGEKTGIQVGLYGEGGLIERLHKFGLVQGGQWLSMSEGFGGFQHALKSGLVAVVQMHDAAGNWIGTDIPGTDRNTILHPAELGAWWPEGSEYGGDAMPTPKEYAQAVWEELLDATQFGGTGKAPAGDLLASACVRAGKTLTLVSNPSVLAKAIAANLPAGAATQAQIEAAVKAALDGATIEIP